MYRLWKNESSIPLCRTPWNWEPYFGNFMSNFGCFVSVFDNLWLFLLFVSVFGHFMSVCCGFVSVFWHFVFCLCFTHLQYVQFVQWMYFVGICHPHADRSGCVETFLPERIRPQRSSANSHGFNTSLSLPLYCVSTVCLSLPLPPSLL